MRTSPTIYIFGNPDLENDSLPLRILPELKRYFPKLRFCVMDPNEEWGAPEMLVIIDSVLGIKEPAVFDDLRCFSDSPRVTLHDFDVIAQLRWLDKLGRLGETRIIGLPAEMTEGRALVFARKSLTTLMGVEK